MLQACNVLSAVRNPLFPFLETYDCYNADQFAESLLIHSGLFLCSVLSVKKSRSQQELRRKWLKAAFLISSAVLGGLLSWSYLKNEDGVTEVLAHSSESLQDRFVEVPCSEDYDSHKRFEGICIRVSVLKRGGPPTHLEAACAPAAFPLESQANLYILHLITLYTCFDSLSAQVSDVIPGTVGSRTIPVLFFPHKLLF